MRLVDGDALLEKWNNLSERERIEFDQVIMCEPTVDANVITERTKHKSSFEFDEDDDPIEDMASYMLYSVPEIRDKIVAKSDAEIMEFFNK